MPRSGDPLEVQVEVRHLGEILRDLKAVEPKLATSLRRNIRNAGKVAAKASQDEVLKDPPARLVAPGARTRTRNSTGARERTARGIRVQIQTGKRTNGVRIVQTQRGFARAYNMRRFRHPVFGNTDVWVNQQGRPYFGSVIARHRDDVRKAIEKSIDEATRHLNQNY